MPTVLRSKRPFGKLIQLVNSRKSLSNFENLSKLAIVSFERLKPFCMQGGCLNILYVCRYTIQIKTSQRMLRKRYVRQT